jgi:phage terminase Nu1 subunit (DNA packaging protein)
MNKELEQVKYALVGLIGICEDQADFKNGVESQGLDEGEYIASRYIATAKQALTALKAYEARLESDELVSNIVEVLNCEFGLVPCSNSTPETQERTLDLAARAAIKTIRG